MPSDIHAILLVPHEGDPHDLLRGGSCRARPPRAWCWSKDGKWREWEDVVLPGSTRQRHGVRGASARALVLAWDGEVDPFGCALADIRSGRTLGAHASWCKGVLRTGRVVNYVLPFTIVLLDASGREVPGA